MTEKSRLVGVALSAIGSLVVAGIVGGIALAQRVATLEANHVSLKEDISEIKHAINILLERTKR